LNGCVKRRRAAAWLLSAPLMVLGSLVAHVLAYRLVYPEASVRLSALLASGHSYMVGYADFWPLVFGAVGGVELVGVSWVVIGGVARRRYSPVPAWAFGLVPPVGFALQEFLERWMAGVSFPWQMVLERTFRIGLLLQVPFAFAAFVFARLLLRVAEQIAHVFCPTTKLQRSDAVPRLSVRPMWMLRPAVNAEEHAGRGPPLIALALL
jgi:hypothetical protein